MKKLINWESPLLPEEEMPKDVEYVYAISVMCSLGGFIGLEESKRIDIIIDNYPKWFPEEVEMNKRWNSIPNHIKDEYYKFKSLYDISDRIRKIVGEPPHPELLNKGIIARTEHYFSPNQELIERKHIQNEEWSNKVRELEREEKLQEFNRLFNPYGIEDDGK